MKLTKDEARILFSVLEEGKYNLVDQFKIPGLMDKLEQLENKLFFYKKDQRRTGRTSQDDFSDCIKRFISKH